MATRKIVEADDVLDVSRMFTWAVEHTFRSDRPANTEDKSLPEGKRKQEAAAQALLDYILRQGSEASYFGIAMGIPNSGSLEIAKEVRLRDKRRVDHLLSSNGQPVAYIEDKVWAGFGAGQLKSYARDIRRQNAAGRLVVIVRSFHLDRAIHEASSAHVDDVTQVVSWAELAIKVRKAGSRLPHLWESLSKFAEEIGSANLVDIASVDSFPQAQSIATELELFLETASEISDLYMRERAAALGERAGKRTFTFSTHHSNDRPWLQAGATGAKKWGLEIDPGSTQFSALWLVHRDAYWAQPLRIGYFKHGLTAAAREHIRWCARNGVELDTEFDLGDRWDKRLGTKLSKESQDALNVLLHVFDSRTVRNFLPIGTKLQGVNDHPSRYGMRFVLGGQTVEAFMGPPDDLNWASSSIFLRTDDFEEEVCPLKRQTGKDYVERVWRRIRELLTA